MPYAGDEAALLARLKRGEPGAQAAFIDAFEPIVRRVIVRVLGVGPDLADALQEALLRTFRGVGAVQEPRALKPWAVRVAVSAATDQLRQRKRTRWLVFPGADSLPEPRVETASNELRAVLRATYRVLDRLPANERVVFVLRRIDGMELAEVASACGVSLATVKRRLARAETRFFRLARRSPELSQWVESEVCQ